MGLRILMLTWNYPPVTGGIEYVAEHLVRGLRARGHAVRVVTAHAADAPPEPETWRAGRPGLKAYVLFSFFRGFSLCRAERPDVIVCSSVVSAPAGWILSRLFRRPLAVLAHGSDILYPGWLYTRAVRWLFGRADRLCANSGRTRDLLVAAGQRPERIAVVPPGVLVPPADASPPPLSKDLADRVTGRRVLMTVGRLIRRKGVLEFVEQVMPPLAREFPDVLYVVVGDDARHSLVHRERRRDLIARRVQELGLERHVYLAGRLRDEEVSALYREAKVFVLPARDIPGDVEGFGIVFLEAALAGLPSVATRVGGIPEAVEDGVTGRLVKPDDAEAMRAAVADLLRNDTERRRLGEAGRQRARDLFSWEAISARYEAVCQDLAAGCSKQAQGNAARHRPD